MKKLSKYIIILCAIGSIAWSGLIEGRKQTGADLVTGGAFTQVAGAAVTLANMKISAVDGTAFIDFSTADLLTDHIGKILTVKDSAGKVLVGYIKAAGTGETLDTTLVSNGTMEADSDWADFNAPTSNTRSNEQAQAGTYSRKIVSQGAYRGAQQAAIAGSTQYALYYTSFYIYGDATNAVTWLVSETTPVTNWYGLLSSADAGYVFPASWTHDTKYFTKESTSALIAKFYSSNSALTFYGDNFSVQKILTPSATGVTIVSTPGGATYNWTYQETGFNYNDSSNYTYEIYAADFTYGTGWYPSSNTAVKVVGTASALEQDVSAVVGVGYQIVWTNDQSTTGKSINAEIGGTNGAAVTADATTTNEITATTTGNFKIEAADDWAGVIGPIEARRIYY